MNRDEAIKVLTQVAPSIKDGNGPLFLMAVVRQAAELIASEAVRTSEGPLKDFAGYKPPEPSSRRPVALPVLTQRERALSAGQGETK